MLWYRRGKRKVINDYGFNEIYKYYKERWGDKALPKPVVRKIYSKLFPGIVKLMVYETLDFRMPCRLGSLRVRKKKTKPKINKEGNLDARGLSLNFKKTKELWEKLYPGKTAEEISAIENKPVIRETNDHSEGYRMTFWWDKITSNIVNQTAYYIKVSRDNCKILSQGVKHNNLNFYT
jgi:hypothetical protein